MPRRPSSAAPTRSRYGSRLPAGRTLDGHHRERIAADLGAPVEVITVTVADDDEAREVAVTLNADRRQLTTDQRRAIVADLRAEGHSLRAIAGAVGVDPETVRKDVKKIADPSTIPARVTRKGGGTYPAHREPRPLPPAPGRGETPAVREARRRSLSLRVRQDAFQASGTASCLLVPCLGASAGLGPTDERLAVPTAQCSGGTAGQRVRFEVHE